MKQTRDESKLHFKTIILSDLHLGSPYCQIEKFLDFLYATTSETLILNGDFIDGWSLIRKGGWSHRCTRCLRVIVNKAREEGTRVVYVGGNHDDFLDKVFPFSFEPIEIVREFEHQTREGTYLVTHGDGFDSVTSDHKWLAMLGDVGYQLMMKSNSLYNRYSEQFQWPDFSISRWTKARVKSVVAFVDKYEEQLQDLARARSYRGIICGHIHTPADKWIGDFHYLNSGDWVESNTAVVEHFEGGFELVDYAVFQKLKRRAKMDMRFRRKPKAPINREPESGLASSF